MLLLISFAMTGETMLTASLIILGPFKPVALDGSKELISTETCLVVM